MRSDFSGVEVASAIAQPGGWLEWTKGCWPGVCGVLQDVDVELSVEVGRLWWEWGRQLAWWAF